MASSLRNNLKSNVKQEEYKNKNSKLLSHRHSLNWQTVLSGALILLFTVGLLTQLPGVSLWIDKMVGEAVGTWLFRVGMIAAMVAISVALIRAFFAYVREEFDIGPTPICAFFMLGVILALLNSI